MTTASQLQLRRGTDTQVAAFTGAAGEVTPDTTNNRLVLHDGTTVGGHPQASEDMVNAAIAAAISGAGVSSLNGQTGALVLITQPQGRLTLTSDTSVMATSVAAATTIYYTPCVGNQIPIFDGTNLIPTTFPELSIATTDTTHNPAAIGASKVNDWFVWNDGGTLRLIHGPDWTSDTTRSAGGAIVLGGGYWFNAVDITNGPAAYRGTYVGTTRSNSSSSLDWVLGSMASGGGAAKLYVWNAYNQVQINTTVTDTQSTWTYSSTTVRQARAQTGMQVNFVAGLPANFYDAEYHDDINPAVVNGSYGGIGIAMDSITVMDKRAEAGGVSTTTITHALHVKNTYGPQTGAHYVAALEYSDGTNNTTYTGGAHQGLHFSGWF